MQLYHNTENDLVINIKKIHYRSQIMQQLKQRFLTYGYHEIYTSTFENYDLYAKMNGTVNHREMLKTIDNTGQVLVLRPDITIPITQQIALNNKELHEDLRYFYILDVFRQSTESSEYREKTQAGVEYFGNSSPEADAEIIALAIQLFKDIQIEQFKIELGHAGFFEQLAKEMQIAKEDLAELKQYIQAKNITEIEQLLSRLSIADEWKEIVTALPFLYGKPLEVIEKARQLPLNDNLEKTLLNLKNIYDVLCAYDVESHIVIDLSLINHMDYYSDMIFQGFVPNIGKPILMGGRYNTLANQFDAKIPAIGFACEIDSLLEVVEDNALENMAAMDVAVIYNKQNELEALKLARTLRKQDLSVVTYVDTARMNRIPEAASIIHLQNNQYTINNGNEKQTTDQLNEVIDFLKVRN